MAEGPPMDRKGFATRGESLGEFVSTLVETITESVLKAQSRSSDAHTPAAPHQLRQATVAHDGSYILLDHTLTKFPERATAAVLLLFHASMRGGGVPLADIKQIGEPRHLFRDHEWWNDKIVKDEEPGTGKTLIHMRVDGMHLKDWCLCT